MVIFRAWKEMEINKMLKSHWDYIENSRVNKNISYLILSYFIYYTLLFACAVSIKLFWIMLMVIIIIILFSRHKSLAQ